MKVIIELDTLNAFERIVPNRLFSNFNYGTILYLRKYDSCF